jgi:hypothetical protein
LTTGASPALSFGNVSAQLLAVGLLRAVLVQIVPDPVDEALKHLRYLFSSNEKIATLLYCNRVAVDRRLQLVLKLP